MNGPDNILGGGADPPRGALGSSSTTLIEGVRRHDPESERRLMFLYGPLVFRRCRAKVRNEEDARDITQEVFTVAFSRIAAFRLPGVEGDGGFRPGFRSWLYAILERKIGDHVRRDADSPRAAGGARGLVARGQAPDPWADASSAGATDEAIVCRRALELVRPEFEPTTWRAAWMLLVEGKSAAETASAVGRTPNATYIARSRVLKRLREMLADLGESPGPADPDDRRPEPAP